MAEHVLWCTVALMALTAWPAGLGPVALDQGVEVPPEVQLEPQPDAPELAPPDDGDPAPDPVPSVSPETEPPAGTGGLDAQDDQVSATVAVPVNIFYTDNDVYPEPVTAQVTVPPQHGTVTNPQPELFVYEAGETVGDTDAFVYQVCTAGNSCDEATVTIAMVTREDMVPETDAGVVAEPPGPTAPSLCQAPLQWDGHSNGRIPADALQSIGEGQRLMREAATAFVAMREAAAAEGVTVGVTDSYRSFEAQVAVRAAKGGVVATATPGTSVHGWGKALDLKVQNTQVRRWLEQHSRAYAWINPPWAKRPGKSFEPWHYEYYGVGVNAGDPRCAGIGRAIGGAGGSSESATDAPGLSPTSFSMRGGSMGLGVGAFVSLIGAGLIVFRDLRRTREIRDFPPP